MSILVGKDTRLVVQGITGREGAFHTKQMIEYGTNVVAGVTPGKGGEWAQNNIPVFDTVKETVDKLGANTSRRSIGRASVSRRRWVVAISTACFAAFAGSVMTEPAIRRDCSVPSGL